MLKNKLTTSLIAGGMAVVGLVAGVATMASAQTASTSTVTPTAAVTTSTTSAVDTPEPGDVADTAVDTPEPGDVADTATSVSVGHPGGHVESANDTDGTAGAEASEPAGSSDTSDN